MISTRMEEHVRLSCDRCGAVYLWEYDNEWTHHTWLDSDCPESAQCGNLEINTQ